jgi:hypothetical protein
MDLYPVMSELVLWSAKNVDNKFSERGRKVIKSLQKDKNAKIKEVVKNYKKIKTKIQIS